MLKNLKDSLVENTRYSILVKNKDAEIACRIIDILFGQINDCIQKDRSKMKLNAFSKAFIGRVLGNEIRNNIKGYILGMYDNDIKNLLDSLQKEFNQRNKT